ncbi:copper resistance protein NlpE [Shewanella khirikhana]|uniref:copper resistance protein NlpE n=1 Tax=Shewanella khirikhana TaxID=1965282 RepID=UPI0030D60B4D
MKAFKQTLWIALLPLALAACSEPSAQKEPSATKEPSAQKQPSAQESLSAQQQPSAQESLSAQQQQDTPPAPAVSGETPNSAEALSVGDSSRTSLDWNGSYEGVVPCASCEGINTRLVLNADGTYLLETQYLGEQEAGAEPEVFEERGSFRWNASGGAIQLESGAWYQVGENQLFMLDRDGKRITGALADHYRLGKQL